MTHRATFLHTSGARTAWDIIPMCRPLRCGVEADLGMPPLNAPGSSEEIAVKPPKPLPPKPSALLSGLSVAARLPAHACYALALAEQQLRGL